MAARSLWTGAISFGLVNVPVRLYPATGARDLHFHMLHGKDDARIQVKRFCTAENAEVPYEEIVKGFEVSRGRYVRIDPAELEKLHPTATHTIEVEDFVDLAEIDPLYFAATYHVAPDKGAGRAFALLRDAMREVGKVAIAKMVMRTKQYLCAVRPSGSGLLLSTMFFADEVVAADEIDLPTDEQAPKARELEMARRLIESLSAKWQPEKYDDDYRAKVLELIERKAEGQHLTAVPERELAPVVNLADALEKSLAAARQHQAPRRGERRAPAERPSAKRAAARRSKSS